MLSVIITVVLGLVAIVAVYVLYMSSRNGELQKLGFVGPKCRGLMGSSYSPTTECLINQYREFKQYRAFGTCALRLPTITLCSLDLIRDVLVKHFNHFPNHRHFFLLKSILSESLFQLQGDRWKRVRKIVSPTFNSGRIRRMSPLIEKKTKDFVDHLKEQQESGAEIEMKELSTVFTIDIIANSVFGVDVSSTKDPENEFVKSGKHLLDTFMKNLMLALFLPFLVPLINAFGISFRNSKGNKFFADFICRAVEERRKNVGGVKRDDYLQIILDLENENQTVGESPDSIDKELQASNYEKKLSQSEMESASAVFFLAGSDTVANVLSFTLFMLAHNPEVLEKVQAEIDQQLTDKFPGYDQVHNMTYLDMCLNEVMRIYPPGYVLERDCVETVHIDGITFPKGYTVQIPVYAIHHDPDIWPNPDKFDPERFLPENKATRHSCAFLPFGLGPRGCIGMRLAQAELKIAVAAVLQHLIPVPCDKSVYPITLEPMRMQAAKGLWVKFDRRKKTSV